MKKYLNRKTLMSFLVLALLVPVAFVLTACGGGNSGRLATDEERETLTEFTEMLTGEGVGLDHSNNFRLETRATGGGMTNTLILQRAGDIMFESFTHSWRSFTEREETFAVIDGNDVTYHSRWRDGRDPWSSWSSWTDYNGADYVWLLESKEAFLVIVDALTSGEEGPVPMPDGTTAVVRLTSMNSTATSLTLHVRLTDLDWYEYDVAMPDGVQSFEYDDEYPLPTSINLRFTLTLGGQTLTLPQGL